MAEIIDGVCGGLSDLLTCAPWLSPQAFGLQGFEKALRDSIVPAVSLSAHECTNVRHQRLILASAPGARSLTPDRRQPGARRPACERDDCTIRYDDAMNGTVFQAYTDCVLMPALLRAKAERTVTA